MAIFVYTLRVIAMDEKKEIKVNHYGDRTVDQMVQAARSTKQNIAEGNSDGQTSTETELKLLGIARFIVVLSSPCSDAAGQ